jgi:hypothetical protein
MAKSNGIMGGWVNKYIVRKWKNIGRCIGKYVGK